MLKVQENFSELRINQSCRLGLLRLIKYLTGISQKLLAILFATKNLASVPLYENILGDVIDLFKVTLFFVG